MTLDLQTFAVETLLWTGALIALVLILRRPVARHFGARAAYALWALPFLRLLFPPVVLPAWLAPAPAPVPVMPVPLREHVLVEAGGGPVMLQPLVASPPVVDWALVALAVWLVGALVFLVVRFSRYFAMRGELLAAGTQVGEREGVRLVETAATPAPVAFGVLDKVIALPVGFLSHTEPNRRDLALEHELAHHRAHDLLANALVQPLFALHWFNPLGWIGWRAMRRDQEAACDARVVGRCDPALRQTYATTIASFATRAGNTGSLALAAAMACPVLGDKSIIHRLRSLTMSDISPRRRLAARMLMVSALVALPLTATISQAEALNAPAAPSALGAPAAPAAPPAPAAPGAPEAPPAPALAEGVFMLSDGEPGTDGERVVRVERTVERDGSGNETGQASITINGREATPEERAEIEARLEDLDRIRVDTEGLRRELSVVVERMGEDGELREQMEDIRRVIGENGKIHEEVRLVLAEAQAQMPEIRFECDGSNQVSQERIGTDGKKVMVICQRAGLATATSAITSARRAVERDRSLSDAERTKALRALDEAMREIRSAS